MTRTPNGLAALFGRLTDPQDRETYAALISFVDSLPPGDELFRIVELLGLLSLVGQRVPAAFGEFLAELRSQTQAAKVYHGQIDARLAGLPSEIAAGVDVAGVAKGMSEAFRQQLGATGLHDAAALLKAATITIKQLSGEFTATLKPAASTLETETRKLITTARQVEEQNATLITRERSHHWKLQAAAVFVAFLVGGLAGIFVEKRQTSDLIGNIGARVEQVQTPALPIVAIPRKNGKQGL